MDNLDILGKIGKFSFSEYGQHSFGNVPMENSGSGETPFTTQERRDGGKQMPIEVFINLNGVCFVMFISNCFVFVSALRFLMSNDREGDSNFMSLFDEKDVFL